MRDPHELIAIYNRNQGYLAKNSKQIAIPNIEEILSAIFTPGPHFYYILDSSSLTFDYCSPTLEKILGINLEGRHLTELIANLHPEDLPFVFACEDYVAKFIKNELSPKQILNYKFSYCLREKTHTGDFKLFQMQTVTLATTDSGSLSKVLGVHSDVSGITEYNSHRLSIIDLLGEESQRVISIPVAKPGDAESTFMDPKFTKREREVIVLIGEGMTTKQISKSLFVSEETIISHRKNILAKSNCKNTAQLISFCVRNGHI